MAADIMSELNPNDYREFTKDFSELRRVYSGIDSEYSKLGKDIKKYIKEFNEVVGLFNKKYKNLVLRLNKTTEELLLRIFIKEDSVKDVFVNVASKFNGLKAIGATDAGQINVNESDKFSKEANNIKNKLFINYFEENASGAIFLEYYKTGMIELHCGKEECKAGSPEFKLCGYYAVKDGINKVEIYEKLSAMGFTEMPVLDKVINFFKKFNPRIEE